MTTMNNGLIIGKFCPITNGHLTAFSMALTKCNKLNVVVCIDHLHDPDCGMTPEERIQAVKEECKFFTSRVEVHVVDCTSFPYAKEDDEEVSKYWAEYLHSRFTDITMLFGSEDYVAMMAKHWPDCLGINYEILDKEREITHVSATMVRGNPSRHWSHIPASVRPYFTKNVLVLGAESCGKSTLSRELAKIFHAPLVPEMYRSIYKDKGMDFTPNDLMDVARAQMAAQAESQRTVFNKGLVIHDTCVGITQMYLNEYFDNVSAVVEQNLEQALRREPTFDLILFCDMDVDWVNDGTRTLGNPDDRKRMRDKAYSVAVQKAKKHGCELKILPGNYKRLHEALDAVRGIM
ncbi:MAG: AAA family ATPase [Cetobacterium sp.]|uniref:AAA family ATPase n=1 Tax=Cetobacterium sp. TaxID=2071632 RepID=UPI003EE5F747